MRRDFPIELVAQNNHVLKLIREGILVRLTAVPDLRLSEEAEPGASNYFCVPAESVRSEEDGCPEDALESGNQSSILLAALMHAEGFEHFGCCSEPDGLTLLSYCERGQVNWNDPILAKGKSVVGVSRNLENEIAVTPFVNRFAWGRLPDWQSTQDERSGTESQVLSPLFPFQPNQAASFGLAKLLLRDNQLRRHPL
jgi:hypothetical protein